MTFPETNNDATKEELIPLSQVVKLPFIPRRRQGRKLSISAVYRWAKNGVGPNKVRLETVQFGGTKCTTVSRLLDFFRRLDERKEQGNRRGDRSRPDRISQMEAELQRKGL